jgi:ATP-dependent Lon protease
VPRDIAELLRKKGNYEQTLPYLVKLPWELPEEKPIDLTAAERVLNEDHYGLDEVKERIIECLAVYKLNPRARGPIICFVGEPGVGKTSLVRSIARAMGRKLVRVSLGGVSTESFIRGHEFTFLNSQPGIIIRALCEVRARNCVMLLDEIDKLGNSVRHGDPAAALLEVLDPAQNNAFRDVYLDVPFDLSRVVFIATANDLDKIPVPLRDRMEVIEHNGYTMEEKFEIARRHLVHRQLSENGLKPCQAKISDATLRALVEQVREPGVRALERKIAKVLRKEAVRVAKEMGPNGPQSTIEMTN